MAGTISTDLTFFTGASTNSSCDSATGWGGITPTVDSEQNIEGSGCCGIQVKNPTTTTPCVYTLAAAMDITGRNMYAWITGIRRDQWDTKANGGIRMRVDDGTRYAEWYVAGKDTLPHQGWMCHSCSFVDTVGAAIAYRASNTTYTTQTTAANNTTANDMNLLPAAGNSVGDLYYFGHQDQFRELLINIGTAGVGTWTITWEYSLGNNTWATLPEIVDNTTNFTTTGVRTVKYALPSDWYTDTVNSIANMYWIRANVTSYSAVTTRPLGTRAWVRFGATPNRAGLVGTDTNDGIECNYSAITRVGFRFKTLVSTNRGQNIWWDAVRYGTKLTVTGGTTGSPGTFTDIMAAEGSNYYGIVTESEGVLNTQGILEFGTTTNGTATYFKDTNYHLRFKNTLLGPPHNGIRLVGNATANTELVLGDLTTVGSNNMTTGGLLIDTNEILPVDAAIAHDASVGYTNQTSAAASTLDNDMLLLPTPGTAVGDAYYFGSSEPFPKLGIAIGTAGAGVWTITWEYSQGSGSWAALPNVADGTGHFRPAAPGTYWVTWTTPADWATDTVNGTAGLYWVRARVSAYTSRTTQPLGTQAFFDDKNGLKWIGDFTNTTNTTLRLYGTKMAGAQRLSFGSATAVMDNVHLVACNFERNHIIYYNLDSADTASLNEQNTISNSAARFATHIYSLGNWKQNNILSNTYGLVLKAAGTFTLSSTTLANNASADVYYFQSSGTTILNLIDSTDNPVAAQLGSNAWELFEKTTYDLNLKKTDGSNLESASVQLVDTNGSGTEQFVGLTDTSGNIATQQILRRTRIYSGSVATTAHNPYRLRMRMYGYIPQDISGKSFSNTPIADSFALMADAYATDAVGTVSTWTGITIDETPALSAAIADDGGAMTDETTAANNVTTNDMTLLPTTPAVNDAYYFGGPFKFSNLNISVFQAGAGTATWTLAWEYYNGAGWSAVSNLTDGTSHFRPPSTGPKTVSWTLPNNWQSSTVNSQGPFYYVRARVASYSAGTVTQPKGTQAWLQNRIELTTTGRTLNQVYEYLRYYTALTSPSHLSLTDPIITSDGYIYNIGSYAFLVNGVTLSNSDYSLIMPLQDFYTLTTGTHSLKKLQDIDGIQVSVAVINTVEGTACYIVATGAPLGAGTVILNADSDNTGTAAAGFTYTANQPVMVRARNKGYLPFETSEVITDSGLSVSAIWQVDPNFKLEVSGASITFNNADPDTIVRNDAGSFAADGWEDPGYVTITGSTANNGKYLIDSVSGNTITLDPAESLTAGTNATGVTLTFTRD